MKYENEILGIAIIAIGLFLSIDSALQYYYYNYTSILFFYMHYIKLFYTVLYFYNERMECA